MRKVLFAMMLMVAATSANAADYQVYGAGVLTCEEWLHLQQDQQSGPVFKELQQSWVLGYITASSVYSVVVANVTLSESDADAMYEYVNDYCKAHPSKRPIVAVAKLVSKLTPEKK